MSLVVQTEAAASLRFSGPTAPVEASLQAPRAERIATNLIVLRMIATSRGFPIYGKSGVRSSAAQKPDRVREQERGDRRRDETETAPGLELEGLDSEQDRADRERQPGERRQDPGRGAGPRLPGRPGEQAGQPVVHRPDERDRNGSQRRELAREDGLAPTRDTAEHGGSRGVGRGEIGGGGGTDQREDESEPAAGGNGGRDDRT